MMDEGVEYRGSSEDSTNDKPSDTVDDPEIQNNVTSTGLNYAVLMIFTILFYTGTIGTYLILPQYLRARMKREENVTSVSTNSCFINKSDPEYIKNVQVQEDSSRILAEGTFAGGVPCMLTVIIYGAFSDRLGRKTIIAIPYFGLLFMNLALALIVNLDLPIVVYPIASFVNGFTGSFSTMIAGVFAYVADITRKSQRSLAIGVMEAVLGLSMTLTNLIIGFWIASSGYGAPMIGLTVLSGASIIFFVCLKETRKNVSNRSHLMGSKCQNAIVIVKAQARDIKMLFLYNKRRSICLMLLVGAFTIHSMSYIGMIGVTTLYLLDQPFCWSSVEIGYFTGIRTFVWLVGGLSTIIILRNRVSDTTLTMVSLASFVVSFGFQGMASSFPLPYCNIIMIAGSAFGTIQSVAAIMLRTMTSKLVSANEQGAAFGLLATGETFSIAFGSAILSLIYSGTVGFLKGFVFFVATGLVALSVLLIIAFKKTYQRMQMYSEMDNCTN